MNHGHHCRRGIRTDRIRRVVAEVFDCELLPLLDDPRLDGLRVLDVTVRGALASLHVSVCATDGSPAAAAGVAAVQEALQRAAPFLRRELAARVRSKRVPDLVLRVVDFSAPNCGEVDA